MKRGMRSVAKATGGKAEIIVHKVVSFSRNKPLGLQFYCRLRTDPVMMQGI